MPPLAPAMVSTGSPGAACTSTKFSTTTASTRARPWSTRDSRLRAKFIARAGYLRNTSSYGDSGPQMVVGTLPTFLLAAVWYGTTLMKLIGTSSVTIFWKVA